MVFWRPYGGGGFDELPAPAPPPEASTAQPRRRPAPAEDLGAATRAASPAQQATGRRTQPSTRASPGSFRPRPPPFFAQPAGAPPPYATGRVSGGARAGAAPGGAGRPGAQGPRPPGRRPPPPGPPPPGGQRAPPLKLATPSPPAISSRSRYKKAASRPGCGRKSCASRKPQSIGRATAAAKT